jgi:hypothetical protein
MNHRVLIPAVLILQFVVGCTPARSPDAATGNLKVEVTPAETTYSVGRNGRAVGPDTNAFFVRFRVSNRNSNPCLIGVMTTGYNVQWRTDNEAVSVGDWACMHNFAVLHLLTSTNSYTDQLYLVVKPTEKGHDVTFRMAFSPITNFAVPPPMEEPPVAGATVIGGTYWSGEIKIKVSE